MIYCSACGLANREGSSYCNGCGAALGVRAEHILPDWLQDTAVTGYLWRGDVVLPDWLAELRTDAALPAGAQRELPTGEPEAPAEPFDVDSEEIEFTYLDDQEAGSAESDLLLTDDLLDEDELAELPDDADSGGAATPDVRASEPWVGFPPSSEPDPDAYAYEPETPVEQDVYQPEEQERHAVGDEIGLDPALPATPTADDSSELYDDDDVTRERGPQSAEGEASAVRPPDLEEADGAVAAEPSEPVDGYEAYAPDSSAPAAEVDVVEATAPSGDDIGTVNSAEGSVPVLPSVRPALAEAAGTDRAAVNEAARWFQSCVEYVLQPQPEPVSEKPRR